MSKQFVKCDFCSTEFERETKEINRIRSRGRKMFCSRVCAGKAMQGNNRNPNGNIEPLLAYNQRDKYTGFREHLRRVRQRGKDYSITLDDLVTQWNKQQGKCPYTGRTLLLHEAHSPFGASLDRIDSSIGYHAGNIQFVSVMANYAKNGFTHEEMIAFCKDVANNYNSLVE